MRAWPVTLLTLLTAGAAVAGTDPDVIAIKSGGDLPADLRVDLARGTVRQGAFEVPMLHLFDGDPIVSGDTPAACQPTYGGASYDRAHHRLAIEETVCTRTTLSIGRATILARLDRAAAWSAESRGDLAGARKQLEAAQAADPGFEEATFNLARVDLRLGDRAAAVAVMRPILARAPIAAYLANAADPTFAPLLDEAPLSELRTSAPGTARIAGVQAPLFAYSARHRLFAIVREDPLGDGDYDTAERQRRDVDLVLFGERGAVVATLSLLGRTRDDAWSYDDLRDDAGAIAIRIDAANRALRDLGFDPLPDAELASFKRKTSGTEAATFARARLGLAVRDGTARLLDHDKILSEHVVFTCSGRTSSWFPCQYPPSFRWAAWVPSQHLVILSWITAGAEHSDRGNELAVWQVSPAP